MQPALRAGRRYRWRVPAAVAAVGAAGSVALAAVRAGGAEVFPTDPLAASALAAGAVAAALARERLLAAGAPRAAGYAASLAVSLLVYQLAGLCAVLAWRGGGPAAAPAVALWNVAWIPPLALLQLGASAAVRTGAARLATHVLVPALLGTTTVAALLLARPAAPFTGLPTIAPEAWRTALAPVDAAATLLGAVGLLVLPVALWRAAATSRGPVRARLGTAATGATLAPLAVAFCVLLAVARNPGRVEPELGSVAFLVALAGAAAVAAWCAVLAARATVGARSVAVLVRGTGLAAAALVVLAVGTLAVAPGVGMAPTAAASVVATTTVAVLGLAWAGTGALARALTARPGTRPGPPPGPPDDRPVPGPAAPDAEAPPAPAPALRHLTPREREVLGLLAEGASNAGIAAQLVVSDRTVDAHLRAVFHKLGLEQDSVVNRRVRAARIWLDHSR